MRSQSWGTSRDDSKGASHRRPHCERKSAQPSPATEAGEQQQVQMDKQEDRHQLNRPQDSRLEQNRSSALLSHRPLTHTQGSAAAIAITVPGVHLFMESRGLISFPGFAVSKKFLVLSSLTRFYHRYVPL